MKEFFIFICQNPKIYLTAAGVIVSQIAKLIGVEGIDEKILGTVADALSVIFGGFGLYWSSKAKYPEKDQPGK